jgi:hypothetical protein
MKNEKVDTHRIVGRIIGVSAVIGTSVGWLISIRAHGTTEAYGGVLSIIAFGTMWTGVVVPLTLGYLFIKKKDIVNHKKWMIRFFGALFGSFFFWRIEALVLQSLFSSANGWLFYTVTSWLLGMVLFDYAAKKSDFYVTKTSELGTAIS